MRYSMYWRRFIMLIDYPLFTFSESPDMLRFVTVMGCCQWCEAIDRLYEDEG